jgi:hypothetical protein
VEAVASESRSCFKGNPCLVLSTVHCEMLARSRYIGWLLNFNGQTCTIL